MNIVLPSEKESSQKWLLYSFIATLFAIAILFVIAPLFFRYFPECLQGLSETSIIFLLTVIFQTLLFLPVLTCTLLFDKGVSFREKLALHKWKFAFIYIVVGIEIVLLPSMGTVATLFRLLLNFFSIPTPKPISTQLMLTSSDEGFLILAIAAIFIAPIVEEVIFRRVIYSYLSSLISRIVALLTGKKSAPAKKSVEKKHLIAGMVIATLITSTIFSVIHMSIALFPSLFLMGLVLQGVYIFTGSLYPAIMLHATHNSVVIAIIMIARYFDITI